VVARSVARALKLKLDVMVVKKIGSPGDPELAIGALAPDGVSFIDWRMSHRVGADENYINSQINAITDQIKEKSLRYRRGMSPVAVAGKAVILVDDGIATGATLEAAIKWLKKKKAKHITVAVPVAPSEVVGKIRPEVNSLVTLATPEDFRAVGQFYEEFPQVEDDEVVTLLKKRD